MKKIAILFVTIALFSIILVGANNITHEQNETAPQENFTNEIILIDLEKIKNLNETLNENETLNKSQNIVLTKKKNKTKNKDEGAPSPSSTSEKEIIEEETISISLYNQGKKEIEGEIPKSFEGEIEKTESQIDEKTKEVIIKSEEHLDAPLIVYQDIEETQSKEDIIVFWKNEDKKIDIKEYLDTNNNGLIDRISWIVPHLSEQIFEITVNSTTIEDSENELTILSANLTNNTGTLELNIEINYSYPEKVGCNFSIETENGIETRIINDFENPSIDGDFDIGLDKKSWEIYCWDKNNSSIIDSFLGEVDLEEIPFEITGITSSSNYLNNEAIPFGYFMPFGATREGLPRLYTPQTSFSLPTAGPLEIQRGMIAVPGNYTLEIGFNYYAETLQRNHSFYVAGVSVENFPSQINENQEIEFIVNLDSPEKQIYSLQIDFDDGTAPQTLTYSNPLPLSHTYVNKGEYNPEITFLLGGEFKTFEIGTLNVLDPSTSNEAPEVDLIFPKDGEIIRDNRVTFKYEANDDKKINSCTFELYIEKEGLKELDYTTTDNTIIIGQENEVKLTSFEDGDYSWYVFCEDNESKEIEEREDFTIQTKQHDKEDEIEKAMNALEDFMEKEETLGLDERNALEELGISDDLKYYSKRLVQIDQDLGNNLKFINNETLREKRTQETIDELEEIIEKIPVKIEIIDSSEYIKNSLTANLEEITKQYVEGKAIQMSPKEVRKLAEENIAIQEALSISTKIKKVEIEYSSKKEIITSIKKKITLNDKTKKTILEQIPVSLDEIQFKTKSNELNPNLFEINVDDIDGEIIYYIEDDVDLNELKKTETVLFEENPVQKGGITGYFSAPLSERNNFIWIIVFCVFLLGAGFFGKDIFKMMQMNFWKKEENVRRILEYSEKAKKSLQSDDQEIAKEYYHKIKEIYPLVPKGFRDHAYSTIKKIRIGIDKRDMMNFVKEYEKAKKEKREEDIKKIYKSIQEQYKKLPEKHQQKVYERVIKDQVQNNFSL